MIKFYLWLIIAIFVLSGLGRAILYIKTDKIAIIDLVEALLGIVNSVGLYGYLSKKIFLNHYFWYAIIVIGLGFGIYNIFFSPKTMELIETVGKNKAYLILGLSYLITAPHLYFLYLYGKQINH